MIARLAIVLAALVALAAVGVGTWRLATGGGEGSEPAPASAENEAVAAAERFLDTYLLDDGRVDRPDQDGTTVSEGQAYAMLLAVAIGDRERFDRAWGWARANLQRDDRLLSTLWADGAVADPEPAADADLDAARALILAGDRFADPAYRDAGLEIAEAILAQETVQVEGAPVLVAGPWARAVPQAVNPSYFDPRAYAQLGSASGDPHWGQLAETSRDLAAELVSQPAALPPDWARLESGTAVAASAPDGSEAAFGFDAVRFPVRMSASCHDADRELAASTWRFLGPAAASGHGARLTLDGQPTGQPAHAASLVGAAAAARAAGDVAASDDLLDRATAVDEQSPTYYGSAWVALGRVMLTTDWLGACPEASSASLA
jgi:endoglucanase